MDESFFLIKKAEGAEDLPLPMRQTKYSAGMDLHANVRGDVLIKKGERRLIPAGVHTALPAGYEIQIRPRSGLALNYGIGMVNAPATVDADYRGELKVLLINHGEEDFIVKRGERIAQMVICKVVTADFVEIRELPVSERGESGFGSTGI